MVSNLTKLGNYELAIILPITSENRHLAHTFAAQQSTEEKANLVYFNTLAVLVVNNYLKMLGIATSLETTDSWNPVMRAWDNVADLDIINKGKLECRPVKNDEVSCHIPAEVWDLRLGYMAVQIDDNFKKAAILGFLPQVNSERIALDNFQPPEDLIDRLHDLANSSLVNLGQWLENTFSTGWQTVESLLNPEILTPSLVFRSSTVSNSDNTESTGISRAKLVDLGIQLSDRNIILLVSINPEANDNIAVTVQIHPDSPDSYLPEALSLEILEPSGAVFLEARSRSADNYIQLQFSGKREEQFSLKISLAENNFIENFQL